MVGSIFLFGSRNDEKEQNIRKIWGWWVEGGNGGDKRVLEMGLEENKGVIIYRIQVIKKRGEQNGMPDELRDFDGNIDGSRWLSRGVREMGSWILFQFN
ncbi:hypothetical protein NPIL_106551 [Nephila pilipes]|uniref:Uncharacterized protein n=1 Tax=Nephila pilipes TaxID=299642 RepID=A0A8X6N6M4_NEPPI|nr:hypothetical protein NPIL_106551 [Nephila pilipes]